MPSACRRSIVSSVVALVAILIATLAVAGESREDPGGNVLVTFTLGRIEGSDRVAVKSYQVVAVDGGPRVSLFIGARVPIPSTTFQASSPPGGPSAPLTSYVYQTVGFNAEVQAEIFSDKRVLLDARVEDSDQETTVAGARDDRPVINARVQSIHSILEDGIPLEIVRVDDRTTRSLFVEVRADILR